MKTSCLTSSLQKVLTLVLLQSRQRETNQELRSTMIVHQACLQPRFEGSSDSFVTATFLTSKYLKNAFMLMWEIRHSKRRMPEPNEC